MAFCHRWHLCQTRQRWASPTRVQGPRCRPSHAWVRSHISRVYPWPSADRFGPACWKSPDGGLQTAGRHQRPQPGSLLGGRLSHGVDDALQKHVPLDPWRWVSDAVHRGFRMVPRPIPEDHTRELGPFGARGQEYASSRAAMGSRRDQDEPTRLMAVRLSGPSGNCFTAGCIESHIPSRPLARRGAECP